MQRPDAMADIITAQHSDGTWVSTAKRCDQALFGERAFAGVLALMAQGPDRIRQFTAQLEHQVVQHNHANKWTTCIIGLGSAFEAQISIGNAFIPVISLAPISRGVINVFNMLPGPIKTVVAAALGFG